MQIENSFAVKAAPDRVYEFLLDVNNVVSCVPGAELSEVVDPNTFKGKVRIKVGPVTVSYNGTARITSRDSATRTATLEAEGRETTGSGTAQATTDHGGRRRRRELEGHADHGLHRGRAGCPIRPRASWRTFRVTWWDRRPSASSRSSRHRRRPRLPADAGPASATDPPSGSTASSSASAAPAASATRGARCVCARPRRGQGAHQPDQGAAADDRDGVRGLISLLLLRRVRRSRRRRREANG